MCQFFSAIATRDGRLLFTEEDSHETIVYRAGLRDSALFLRHWVRIEQRPSATALTVDETSVPSWFDPPEWQTRVDALLECIRPIWQSYCIETTAAIQAYQHAVVVHYDSPTRTTCAALRSAKETHAAALRRSKDAYQRRLSTIDGYQAPEEEEGEEGR